MPSDVLKSTFDCLSESTPAERSLDVLYDSVQWVPTGSVVVLVIGL